MKTRIFVSALTGMAVFAGLGYAAASTVSIAEGTSFSTHSMPSEVSLGSGVSLRFSARTAGTLYNDRVVLQHGSVRVGNFPGFTVSAGQWQIDAADPNALAVVRLASKTVEVASLGGILNVTDGAMLTRVASGTHVSFQQNTAGAQTGASPSHKRLPSDQHTMLIVIMVTAAAALAIGLTAAAQGKSPF